MARARRFVRVTGEFTVRQVRRTGEAIVRQAINEMVKVMRQERREETEDPEYSTRITSGASGAILGLILAPEREGKDRAQRKARSGKRPPAKRVVDWIRSGKGAGLTRPEGKDVDAAEVRLVFILQRAIQKNVAQRPRSMQAAAVRQRRRRARIAGGGPRRLKEAADAAARAVTQSRRTV